jgi:hypothetical protein
MPKWKEHPAPLGPVPPVASDDLVARLRADYCPAGCSPTVCVCSMLQDAADRIETLEAQVARLTPSPSSQPPAGKPTPPIDRAE